MAPKRSPRQLTRRSVPERCPGIDLDSHRELITRLYHIEKKSLKEVMRIMRQENIDASEKVFKDKISRWNIRRNLNREDVAAALKISRQAERSKRTCRLYIRGQYIDWKRIQRYLRKNKICAESLLEESDSFNVIPSHVTFDFVDSIATTPLSSTPPAQPRSGPVASSGHLTLDSTPNTLHGTTTALISESTSDLSPNNSSTTTTLHRRHLANRTQNAAIDETSITALPAERNQKDLPYQWEHDGLGFLAEQELTRPILEQPTRVVQQFVGNLINTTDPPVDSTDGFDLYRMMSVTPLSESHSPRQSMTPSNHTVSSFISHTEPDVPLQPGCSAHFLSWSIAACLRMNEGLDQHAELAMEEASKGFEMMVASRHESCLTSLNLLLALFEAHGKRDIAIELLKKLTLAVLSSKNLPEMESVVLTIRFKLDIMGGLKIENMFDPAVLRHIHYRFEKFWGRDSPSTLACLCNLGWRLAGDKDTERLTEALDVLSQAQVKLEQTLGHYDPQTITCMTTLARVLSNLKRHLEGLEMMRTAMDRITTRFPDYHPYRLAALRRLALFMQKARSGDAEPILREVASRRLRILGLDCKLTEASMKELRDFLIKQGRYDDADDASRAIKELASQMCCGENVVQLF